MQLIDREIKAANKPGVSKELKQHVVATAKVVIGVLKGDSPAEVELVRSMAKEGHSLNEIHDELHRIRATNAAAARVREDLADKVFSSPDGSVSM